MDDDARVWDQTVRLEDGRACFEAAKRYLLECRWSVIPLCSPDHVGCGPGHRKQCGTPGKMPLVSWKRYQQELPTERDLADWWRIWPNANVGIALGVVSRMVGVDVDGAGGEAVLAQFAAAGVVSTLEFDTPSGGRRVLYQIATGVPLGGKLVKKLGIKDEVRILSTGAQTVAPPSRHYNGRLYNWRTSDGKFPGHS